MKNNKYQFKFSVIIPVYNVEIYIEETIKSILEQTLGFKENIQIILVNDGSPDNSEKICLKYKNKYPENIVYIKQENSGVSAARNLGMKYVKGKYVNFLDSDDKWDKNSLKRIWGFFEKNYRNIDVVDCRVKYFDGMHGYHIFDKRYHKTRIVNLKKEYDFTFLNSPTAVFKAEAIKGVEFDNRLKFSEDTKFINQVLLKKLKCGICKEAKYLYRKRQDDTSAVDSRLNRKDYYIGPLQHCFKELIDSAKKQYGSVPLYIQNLVLSNIIWRSTLTDTVDVLTKTELDDYKKIIRQLLRQIDDEIIINKKSNLYIKMYLLYLKYDDRVYEKIKVESDHLDINRKEYKITEKLITYTRFSSYDNCLTIHGTIDTIGDNKIDDFYFMNNRTKQKYFAKVYNVKNKTKHSFLGEVLSKKYIFRIELPIDSRDTYSIFLYSGRVSGKVKFRVVKKFALSDKYLQYRVVDKNAIIYRDKNNLAIAKYSLRNLLKIRVNSIADLIRKKKIKTLIKKALYPIKRRYKRFVDKTKLKNIIILESNPDFADNTKKIFDIMIKNKVNEKYELVWFVNDKEEFSNVKIKNVRFINYFKSPQKNDKYAKYALKHAKLIIDANKYVKKGNSRQVRIHLNHGSPFKNALDYNVGIGDVDYDICQSSFFRETEAKVRDLPVKKVIPLGFPRNDVLYDKTKEKFDLLKGIKYKKIILWLPTYRVHNKNATAKVNLKYGLACIDDEKELLKLNKTLQENKVVLLIKFHPAEKTEKLQELNLSNIVVVTNQELEQRNINLYSLFRIVDALITDYSSVYFDFCLTKKNIGLAISDYDEYLKENGEFQYPYKDVIVGNYMYNNKDLIEFVEDVASDKDRTYDERMKLIKQFDDYGDGKATERIYDFISKFL